MNNSLYFEQNKIKVFSGSTLKLFACVAMFLDHFAATTYAKFLDYILPLVKYDVFKHYYSAMLFMRAIGRIAFPIYCFLLVEGFIHTRNFTKYALRLLLIAIISEPIFDLCIFNTLYYPKYNNTLFTLFLGLTTLHCIKMIQSKIKKLYISLPLCVISIAAFAEIAYYFTTDYTYKGILAISIMYIFYPALNSPSILGLAPFYYEPYAFLAAFPMLMYNKKRGLKAKYFFYAFYPLHLLLLYLLTKFAVPS